MKKLTQTDRECRERKLNEKNKRIAKTVAQNLYTYLCVAIPFLLICTIWTDFTLPKVGFGLAGDGILTVVLMVVGERLMVKVGTYGGKLDEEYLEAKERYKIAQKEAKGRQLALLTPFCEWQVDLEFERAKRARCSKLRIKYDLYRTEYEGKTLGELKKLLPVEKAIQVDRINRLEPIELTPDMLLYGCGRKEERREITESGEEYEERKVYGKRGIAVSVVTCIFCVGIPLTVGGAVTLSRIVYTLGKLAVLLYRMFKGYSDGAKAYHTIEVRHLNSKSDYLEEFNRFVDTKQYLIIANEYTEINHIMGHDALRNGENDEIPCIQPDQERARNGDFGSQSNRLADSDRACA